MKKIGIIGAGALGSLYAKFFSIGSEVNIYEKSNGFFTDVEFVQNDISEIIKLNISSEPQILQDCKIIFIFVKSYSTESAMEDVRSFISPDTIIVSLQNGLNNYDIIKNYISDEYIVYGTTTAAAAITEKNAVQINANGHVVIGGGSEAALMLVSDLLNKCNLEFAVTENPKFAMWKKAIANAGINPLGALLSLTNGQIISSKYSLNIQKILLKEAVSTACAIGVDVDLKEMLDLTYDICQKTSSNRCSMYQDFYYKRKTEIDSINGEIIKRAEENNIDVPVNRTLYLLIKAKEEAYLNK